MRRIDRQDACRYRDSLSYNPDMQYAMFILYVEDQQRSRDFYQAVLGSEPVLDVPGMTEFKLTDSAMLGLMPSAGIKRLLGDSLPDPAAGIGIPRCELYIPVDSPQTAHDAAVAAGGASLSLPEPRAWGDTVAYTMDFDGHVLAFAKKC